MSTVTTTARWEGTITPTQPYLPVTVCSKWTSDFLFFLWNPRRAQNISGCTHLCCLAPIDSVLTGVSLPFILPLPGSGMFDDGVHVYLIEPLQQNHSTVSYSFSRHAHCDQTNILALDGNTCFMLLLLFVLRQGYPTRIILFSKETAISYMGLTWPYVFFTYGYSKRQIICIFIVC